MNNFVHTKNLNYHQEHIRKLKQLEREEEKFYRDEKYKQGIDTVTLKLNYHVNLVSFIF